MSRAPIAVTCGDPSGIGPEIVQKARHQLGDAVPFFLIGDPAHVPSPGLVTEIETPADALDVSGDRLPVLTHRFSDPVKPGHPAPGNAKGVVAVIEQAVSFVQNGEAAAVCTAPISKKELVDHAAFQFPGHTEFLAHLADSGTDPVMMLASEELRVVPATIHIPLSEVPKQLSADKLERVIRTTHSAMIRDFGITAPRIALSGINPHAGEGGLLGKEDDAIIRPVCERLAAEGLQVTGPLPADTMFHAAARAQYDVAIAMYHDQALIPIKTLAFDRGVNVTLGLPFIRTSPDHGTAFDIAGLGTANPSSMIEALRLAWDMAKRRAAA